MSLANGSPIKAVSPLSHSELVLKARQQSREMAGWNQTQVGSPQSFASDIFSEQLSSSVLSPSFTRTTRLSPSKDSPTLVRGVRSLHSTAGSRAALSSRQVRSPSSGAPISPVLSMSPQNAGLERTGSAERAVTTEVRRRVQAESQLDELSRSLSVTKAALQASEARANKACNAVLESPGVRNSLSPETVHRLRRPHTPSHSCPQRSRSAAGRLGFGSSSIGAELPRGISQASRDALTSAALAASTVDLTMPIPGGALPPPVHLSPDYVALETTRSLSQARLDTAARRLSEWNEDSERSVINNINKTQQEVAEISHECSLAIAVEQAKIETRSATVADMTEQLVSARREIGFLRDENARLAQRAHTLETELLGRTATSSHKDLVLRETQEKGDLRTGSLQLELNHVHSKLQDALSRMQLLRQERDNCQEARDETSFKLRERTRELEVTTVKKNEAEQALAACRVEGHANRTHLVQEASDLQRQERLMRDKDVGAVLAQVEVCRNQVRDESHARSMMQEQLNQERRSHAACEDSKSQISHLLDELTDQRHVERQMFGKEMQNVQTSVEGAQRQMQLELEGMRAENASLREAMRERDQQLRDCYANVAASMGGKDEADMRRLDAIEELRLSEGMAADLRRSLNSTTRDKEAAVNHELDTQKNADSRCHRLERQVGLLTSELEDARRTNAAATAEIEFGAKRLKGAEESYHTAIGEVEQQSRRALVTLQQDHDCLVTKLVQADKERSQLSFQLADEQDRHRSVHTSLHSEAQQLKGQLLRETEAARGQAGSDSQRLQELERENVHLVAQSADFSRQLLSMESMNHTLRERLQLDDARGRRG